MKSIIEEKSFCFAIRVVNLVKHLKNAKNERILLSQLLRAGTSIGANISEAEYAQSRSDFISKLSIALKEANETDYWLRLLYSTDYLNKVQFISIDTDCKELIRILTSIVNTTKQQK